MKTTDRVSFSVALEWLKEGHSFCREGWNATGMWVSLHTPKAKDEMTIPYLCLYTVRCELVPWVPSQTDVLANDWMLVER